MEERQGKLLALDTALGAASVCLWDYETRRAECQRSEIRSRGHDEILFPLIQKILEECPGGKSACRQIAVTIGPGSFTGLRVGLAVARALALVWEVPVVGVSTLAAFAAPLVASFAEKRALNPPLPDLSPHPRPLIAVLEARHENIYVQHFSDQGAALTVPFFGSIKEVLADLEEGAQPLFVGSAASLLVQRAQALGIEASAYGPEHAPDIAFVAQLGACANPQTAPAVPLYIKEPHVTLKASLTGRPL